MTELVARNLCLEIGDATLVDDANLSLRPAELTVVLGPNGAGKTSLLKAMLGLVRPTRGCAMLDGEDSYGVPPARRATHVSYLPQQRPLAWPNRVRDIVALGRYAHGVAPGRLGDEDAAAVEHALTACDLVALAERQADGLSGGELARVHFARAIAAQAPLLIADEPTAALDPLHQLNIATLIRHFVDSGGGALVVLHDVALAARVADTLVWMKEGRIVAQGSPTDTLNETMLRDVYGVRARIDHDDNGFSVRIEAASGS